MIRKAHMFSWEVCCMPKEHGGLEIGKKKPVNEFYFLFKTLQNSLANPNDLWCQMLIPNGWLEPQSIASWLSPRVMSFSSRLMKDYELYSSSFIVWASVHPNFSLKEPLLVIGILKNSALKALVGASHFHDHLHKVVDVRFQALILLICNPIQGKSHVSFSEL